MRKYVRSIKNNAAKVGAGVAVLGSAVGARAQSFTNSDPTTITTGVASAYTTAIGIAIGAITIGAVIMYIRKGLKARA